MTKPYTPADGYVWVRNETEVQAEEAAARLLAKHPHLAFAVITDEMGIPGFIAPFAVVSFAPATGYDADSRAMFHAMWERF